MGQASGQTFVKPGATGSIQIPIQNDATSVDDAADVQISVIAPAFFTVANTSTVGPLSITAGQTNTFVVNYVIAPDAPDGPFDAVFNVTMTNVRTAPTLSVLTSTINFPIGRPQFLVGAQLRSVWQGEAFGGLKFRRERRAYRQAGRQELRAGFLRGERSDPLHGIEGRGQTFGALRPAAGPGLRAQPRLSGQKHRLYRLAALVGARKVKSLVSADSNKGQRLSPPSAYSPQNGSI
jgi:hypothetical protein